MQTEILIKKIQGLPELRQAEVEDFVDFLSQKEDRQLVHSMMKLSEKSLERIWDNDQDAIYDEL